MDGTDDLAAGFQSSPTACREVRAAAKDCVYTFSDNGDSDEGEQLKYKIKNIIQSPANDEATEDDDDDDYHLDSGGADIARHRDDRIISNADIQSPGGSDETIAMPSIHHQHADATTSVETTTSTTDNSTVQSFQPLQPHDAVSEPRSPSSPPSPLPPPSESATPLIMSMRARRAPNGSIPKTGKPLAYAIDKKASRVRNKPKRKALVAMYQSQISDNNIGIKLKLKKSDVAPPLPRAKAAVVARGKSKKIAKSNRKRSRKSKANRSSDDSDDDDDDGGGAGPASTTALLNDKRSRKDKVNNNREPVEQTVWGATLPEGVLYQIFKHAVKQEGCLPTLCRLGRVCALWQRVSLSPSLWTNLDLSRWTRERFRTELKLKWIIENRMTACQDVNMTNWKVTNIHCVLAILAETCPHLTGITLTGWKGFSSDNLIYLVEQFKSLRRIDLSSINFEVNSVKSAVGLQSLCAAIQTMNERLTHLHLAHNRLAGIPQIVTTLSAYCPNLILLDLSNVSTVAISHGILLIEKLQQGCQKLKVLRITNSHITLGPVTLQEQMDSPGFPDLEELSIASLTDESRLINDEFLQRILKSSTKLQLLDVRGCARLTHDSLIRLPTWDLKHLFLSGCSVTRDVGSGLELIASKWAHSLIEFDLAWANVQTPIDNAIKAIAEKGAESPLNHLNLCGSSVSLEAVKEILIHCPHLNSINLASCRGLPRGVKRLLQGTTELKELRDNLGVVQKLPKTVAAPAESELCK